MYYIDTLPSGLVNCDHIVTTNPGYVFYLPVQEVLTAQDSFNFYTLTINNRIKFRLATTPLPKIAGSEYFEFGKLSAIYSALGIFEL